MRRKEKRPARVASETEEGTNVKAFMSDGQRSSVMECASIDDGARSVRVFPLQYLTCIY